MASSNETHYKVRVVHHFNVTCLREVKAAESIDPGTHIQKNKKGEHLYVKEFTETHKKVLFSGSNKAYEIWSKGTLIPADAVIETHGHRIGTHGRGNGRVLLPSVEGGGDSNKDGSALPNMPSGCHSSRVGYP